MAQAQVFDGQTDNGNSTVITLTDDVAAVVTMSASGTFDSGILKLQANMLTSGGTWFDVDTTKNLSAAGFSEFTIYNAKRLRVNLASVAGAAADLDVHLTFPDSAADNTITAS